MDEELAVVGHRLDGQDPAIVASQAAPRRLGEADVEVQALIVVGQRLVPAIVDPEALAAEDRPEELRLHDPDPHAPDVEVAIAARLEDQEDDDEEAHQRQRQGRGLLAAEGGREGDAGRHHRPVGGRVRTGCARSCCGTSRPDRGARALRSRRDRSAAPSPPRPAPWSSLPSRRRAASGTRLAVRVSRCGAPLARPPAAYPGATAVRRKCGGRACDWKGPQQGVPIMKPTMRTLAAALVVGGAVLSALPCRRWRTRTKASSRPAGTMVPMRAISAMPIIRPTEPSSGRSGCTHQPRRA